jgi:dihydrofolate synthase/folylpolyglutamate synthase
VNQGSGSASARLAAATARLGALVDWERRKRAAMRVSTAPELAMLEQMGLWPPRFRVVHVTGSKGKGSTCALIEAGMRNLATEPPLRVGRYASPHVERIHERISIDGAAIEDVPLSEALERALAARDAVVAAQPEVDPTWFDVVTAAALASFEAAGVEWLVAEVGLGGRLDSTNVLDGIVCVITNIELEHTAVLGATKAAIAAEKAGILKRGCTLVTGVPRGDEAALVIEARAAELGVEVLRPAWLERGERVAIDVANQSLAALALDELGRRGRPRRATPFGSHLLDEHAVRAARLPGRLERFELDGTQVVLDGAHTPVSVRGALHALAEDSSLRTEPVIVLGLARDKDLAGILKALRCATDTVVCTSVGSELHRTPEEIAECATAVRMAAETAATPRDALARALSLARRERWVLVIGSLHLAGAIRPHLTARC